MATRKKTKAKAKKTKKKKTSIRQAARKRPVRKPAGKKAVKKKARAKPARAKAKARPKKKAASRTAPSTGGMTPRLQVVAPSPSPAVPAVPSNEQQIGVVTHYFTHLSVAIIRLEAGSLREGDVVRIKGHTSDFTQPIESMEIEHVRVSQAYPGQSVGVRVKDHAREHDVVYKVER